MRYCVIFGIILAFFTLTTTTSCAKKVGCPANRVDEVKLGKDGMPKGKKTRSGLSGVKKHKRKRH